MFIDLLGIIKKNQVVAVALSGGSDSMALLHYLYSNKDKYGYNVIAINVEHGIRGEDSIKDSAFVKSYCDKLSIPILTYSVNSISYAEKEKLSLETSARVLRYNCFLDALNNKKCDLIATAHHKSDNVETILLNIFRGTGIKGLLGITSNFNEKIIRPLINVDKSEIDSYIKENNIPFVIDKTNLDPDYSRNFLRINVIPKIKEIFPDMENAINRLSTLASKDEEFLEKLALEKVHLYQDKVEIDIPIAYPLFARAFIIALKNLNVEKDWEKVHIDSAYSLIEKENGAKIDLLYNVKAFREYDRIVLVKEKENKSLNIPFSVGTFNFNDNIYTLELLNKMPPSLKDGLYLDFNKIPTTAVIRTKKDGDIFTKFGGGTKSLNDYFTDKKIPKRIRDTIPLIADGNTILAIFNVAISNNVKIDGTADKILKIF